MGATKLIGDNFFVQNDSVDTAFHFNLREIYCF